MDVIRQNLARSPNPTTTRLLSSQLLPIPPNISMITSAAMVKTEYGLNSAYDSQVHRRPHHHSQIPLDMNAILTCFSPISEKSLVMPNHHQNIDILIATDCISKGAKICRIAIAASIATSIGIRCESFSVVPLTAWAAKTWSFSWSTSGLIWN